MTKLRNIDINPIKRLKNSITRDQAIEMLKISLIVIMLFALSASDVEAKSFLWEVEVKGEKSYILGSIHMLKKSSFPLKKELEIGFEIAATSL